MMDMETAQQKVLVYVQNLADSEVYAELIDETELEWVFSWNSKQWLETQDYRHRLVGTRCVAVNKATGEICEPTKQYQWKPSQEL